MIFTCFNHENLFIIFNFRLVTNFFALAGKIKAWEENTVVTSAIRTHPEKKFTTSTKINTNDDNLKKNVSKTIIYIYIHVYILITEYNRGQQFFIIIPHIEGRIRSQICRSKFAIKSLLPIRVNSAFFSHI